MVAVIAFMIVLVVGRFPSGWENLFSMASSAITLIVVFVIQHTQSRQQVATQLKLDELIRTVDAARKLNRFAAEK
jgi:low affinity Fe/Cu permease